MPEGPVAGEATDATTLVELGRRSVAAAGVVSLASTTQKDEALHRAADLLVERSGDILAANSRDVERALANGAEATAVDRLRLTDGTCAGNGRRAAHGGGPAGSRGGGGRGLLCARTACGSSGSGFPSASSAIIYENRPNVTSDAAALCVKAGNAALLRGSSGALESNKAVAGALRDGAVKAGLPADVVLLVEDTQPSHRCRIRTACAARSTASSLVAAVPSSR